MALAPHSFISWSLLQPQSAFLGVAPDSPRRDCRTRLQIRPGTLLDATLSPNALGPRSCRHGDDNQSIPI